MRAWGCYSCAASVMGALWALTSEAAEYKRLDGIHRIEKAQVTERAVLGRRDEEVCGASMKLCPSSLDGGCCPVNYDCAKESCYGTTKGPTTCGTKTGWFVCDAVYGGGCCPDGYLCETADACVPPTGSAYTYQCPTGQYLCPASASYGCCPSGMGCAVNQCYSTEKETLTTTMTITTTRDGSRVTFKSTAVTISTPEEPTAEVTAGSDSDQVVLKYFPSSIPKVSPSSTASDDGGGGGGISKGAIAGIVAGSVAFLIIVLVATFITIRHLNKVVAAVSNSKKSDSSNPRPPMREFKPTDSEIDALSVDPLMMSPRPAHPRPEMPRHSPMDTPDLSSGGPTPSAPGGYQQVSGSERNSRQTSFDADDYFNAAPAANPRLSQYSGFTAPSSNRVSGDSHGAYTHVRHWSNASDGSDGQAPGTLSPPAPLELDAAPVLSELPGSPPASAVPPEERRRSSTSSAGGMSRPPLSHQRRRSEQRNRSGSTPQPPLTAVTEEMHGFHGPSDHLVGQTTHRPVTRSTVASEGKESPPENTQTEETGEDENER